MDKQLNMRASLERQHRGSKFRARAPKVKGSIYGTVAGFLGGGAVGGLIGDKIENAGLPDASDLKTVN